MLNSHLGVFKFSIPKLITLGLTKKAKYPVRNEHIPISINVNHNRTVINVCGRGFEVNRCISCSICCCTYSDELKKYMRGLGGPGNIICQMCGGIKVSCRNF